MTEITVGAIVDLAREIEHEDPIDWAMLAVDEAGATELIANNLLDQYRNQWQSLSGDDRSLAMLAVMTHLVVENFALNLKLQRNET